MLRRVIALAAGAVVWASASSASAVTQTSSVTVTENGQPIPSASVTLTVTTPPRTTQRTRTLKRTVIRTRTMTDTAGRLPFRYDDEVVRRGNCSSTSSCTWTTVCTPVRRDVPVEALMGGGEINVGGPTTSSGFRIADNPNPVPRIPGGLYISGHGIGTSADFGIRENDAFNGVQTNRFSDSNSGFGGGVAIGYNIFPPGGVGSLPVVISPFLSGDFLNTTVEHRFSPISFIGEEVNFVGTAGMQLGLLTAPNVILYAVGGVAAAVNKTFTINFGGPIVTKDDQWLWGGTLGAGIQVQPQGWEIFNRPISVFAQYQHIWVEDAQINQPQVSPFFNYRFSNDIEIIKAGVILPVLPRY